MEKDFENKDLIDFNCMKWSIREINQTRSKDGLKKITKCYNCGKRFINTEKVFFATDRQTENKVLICEKCRKRF